MARFVLDHQHTPRECGVVFASFSGFATPLRDRVVRGSCAFGTHRIWWEVEATTELDALSLLPQYVADRTTAVRVGDLRTP